MGEWWRRQRAKRFESERNEAVQQLIEQDLLTLTRLTEIEQELSCQMLDPANVAVGDVYILCRQANEWWVVGGNARVGVLPEDEAERMSRISEQMFGLKEMMPCRVARVDPFGSMFIRLGEGR